MLAILFIGNVVFIYYVSKVFLIHFSVRKNNTLRQGLAGRWVSGRVEEGRINIQRKQKRIAVLHVVNHSFE